LSCWPVDLLRQMPYPPRSNNTVYQPAAFLPPHRLLPFHLHLRKAWVAVTHQ